jgi:hypothetical protein
VSSLYEVFPSDRARPKPAIIFSRGENTQWETYPSWYSS